MLSNLLSEDFQYFLLHFNLLLSDVRVFHLFLRSVAARFIESYFLQTQYTFILI